MKRNSEDFKASSNRALRRRLVIAAGCCVSLGAHAVTVTFASQQVFATPPSPNGVATDDINGDGIPDIVTANYNQPSTGAAVLMNTTAPQASTASFIGWVAFATETGSKTIATADINADNKPDLVVADQTAGVVSVLLNTTSSGSNTATFATQQLNSIGPSGTEQPIHVTTADINGDNKPDLITANYALGSVSVFLNTTDAGAAIASFASPVAFTSGTGTSATGPRAVASADINGDGKPDLVDVNKNENTVSVLLNTTAVGAGTPTFATQQIFATGTSPVSVALADINGDGKPDMIVVNLTDNTVSVLLNTTSTGANVPTFAAQHTFATGLSPNFVATRDIDGIMMGLFIVQQS